MKYWLIKTDANDYTIDDLKKDKETAWTGVRNYQARNFMRDSMEKNDIILFYHSGGDSPAIEGLAKVSSNPLPDETQFDKKSKYFDPKSKKEKPTWILVKIKFLKKLKTPITLKKIKEEKSLRSMLILRAGNRLSITPVTEKEFFIIQNII